MADSGSEYLRLAEKRLEWSKAIIDRLDTEILEFGKTNPVTFEKVSRPNVQIPTIDVYFRIHQPFPPMLSFLAADAVHNLRAVLDNLVWAVGQVSGASEMIAFSFRDDEAKFAKYYQLNDPTIKWPNPVIDWLRKQQRFSRPGLPLTELEQLHALWNLDKHRAPLLTPGGVPAVISYGMQYRLLQIIKTGPLSDGDHVVTFQPYEGVPEGVSYGLDILFSHPSIRITSGVRTLLNYVHMQILTEVLPVFAPYLK